MISLTFLFWNVAGRQPVDHVSAIARERNADVLILAEWGGSPIPLLETLNGKDSTRYRLPTNLSERLLFIVAAPSDSLSPLYDGTGISVRRFSPPIGLDTLVVALHLPSKLYLSSEDQALLATRTREIIERVEDQVGHRRTLVIGDFNMNPFESGVISSEGFHGVMTKSIAQRESRRVLGQDRRFFYNPMWSLLGDESSGPPGSHYYHDSSPITLFWHTFDQALLRPDLARSFLPGDVAIITKAKNQSLLTDRGLPNKVTSDHLPLCATVRVEEFENEWKESLGRTSKHGRAATSDADS